MATIGHKYPTLLDVVNRLKPDGSVETDIVEMLVESNPMLDDMAWIECNDGTTHKTIVRTGLPTNTWRKLNYGVQPSKSKTAAVRDNTAMLENYADVDADLVNASGDPKAFRQSEDAAFVESMSQDMQEAMIYGNTEVHPEHFTGIAPRLSEKSANSGKNIIDAGGSSNLTSIYMIVWGPKTVHGLYPKGSIAGLQYTDKGQVTLQDAAGGNYEGFRSHYKWNAGLSVKDWRYVVRIANIDVTALKADLTTGPNLVDLITQAIETLPAGFENAGNPVIYCNRTIRSMLRSQVKNSKNVHLSLEEVAGKKVVTFDGIPVKRVDAILNTETKVS